MADGTSTSERAGISDDVAKDAFVYAYSMVRAYAFFHETMIETGYPLNRFQNLRSLADDTYTAHPTINNDTLHLMGWLDVAAEPVVVSVPDMDEGRYWILHVMDMGHYTSAMIGSRVRGTRGGAFMFASHAWDGEVPSSVESVTRVDSDLVKLMGRIMATGDQDEVVAREYMDKWNVRTLSEYLGRQGPAPVWTRSASGRGRPTSPRSSSPPPSGARSSGCATSRNSRPPSPTPAAPWVPGRRWATVRGTPSPWAPTWGSGVCPRSKRCTR